MCFYCNMCYCSGSLAGIICYSSPQSIACSGGAREGRVITHEQLYRKETWVTRAASSKSPPLLPPPSMRGPSDRHWYGGAGGTKQREDRAHFPGALPR